MNKSTWLSEYKRDVYSQSGEDGIIEKILELLPEKDKWCVEFGAWDGISLSNTRNLIESKGYAAVLIEGDKSKFRKLQNNLPAKGNVIARNQYVGFTREDGLDRILSDVAIPGDFDLLVIDIDGNDYHCWKAVEKYRPKVVVIEFNPTIPPPVRFVQRAALSVNQGASLSSLVELAKDKGYELVSVLACNAFFVKQEYFPRFEIESNDLDTMWTNRECVTYLFSGYDGTIFLRGDCRHPWHDGLPMKESRMQNIPRFFRGYPPTFTKTRRFLYWLLLYTPRKPHRLIPRRRLKEKILELLEFLNRG